jgi:tetratricopeptide (TPR) repeat protein
MPNLSPNHPQTESWRWIVPGIYFALVAMTWIVFGQTIHYDFVNYDDVFYIHERPEIRSGLTLHGVIWAFTHSHASNWHPLTSITHMLDCQLYGMKAGGHHFTNVVLHTIAVVLLFLVLRQMTGGPSSPQDESVSPRRPDRTDNLWRSAFVAALFAIHPLHVESVAWIAERKDVLSGVFFMVTLGAYLSYVRKPSLTRYMTMSILFACGLMSKAMLVTVPFILLLLDYWPLQRVVDLTSLRRAIVEKIPLFLLSAGMSVTTFVAQGGAVAPIEQIPFRMRVGNALVASVIYIWQLFWPRNITAFYPYDYHLPISRIALALGLLLFITVSVFVLRKKRPYLITGWFWYLGMLVPVIGLVQVGSQAHADRYTYLSQIGLYLALTWAVTDLLKNWRHRREILGAGATIVIAVLACRAGTQTKFWRDSETLWRHAISATSQNYFAHAALGDFLITRNRAKEAIAQYQEALEIRPDKLETHNKVGLALFRIGNPSDAITHWETVLEIDPHDLETESNLAWVFATCPEPSMRDGTRAVKMIQDVLTRSGARNAITLHTLAAAYAECGRFSEAISAAQEALDLAVAQANSALAADLRNNIDNYSMNVPLRDPSLANAQTLP